jgi:hypothetical protein
MRRRLIVVLSLVALVLLLGAPPGKTISLPHPEPARRLTVQGFVTGKLAMGQRVRFHLVGTDPDGWLHLNSLQIAMMLHGQPIQEITFSLDDSAFGVTGQEPVPIGTSATIAGSFLDVLPGRSFLIRSTFSLRLIVWTRVSAEVPKEAEFHIRATDDDGRVSLVRRPARFAAGFLSWGSLAVAVAIALFAGAFVGNTFSSRRYRERAPSIWDVVDRRLKEQKVRPPTQALAPGDGGVE